MSRTQIGFNSLGAYVKVDQPIFVTNVGTTPLVITALDLGGLYPGDFIVGGTCGPPAMLPPGGGRCRIDIVSNLQYTGNATETTARSAVLSIGSNAVPAIPDVPIFASYQEGVGAGFITPDWLDFSPQAPGTTSIPQTITVKNRFETTTFFVDRIIATRGDADDFSVTTACAKLLPGESCTADITFRPGAAGPRSAQLEIDYSTLLVLNSRGNDTTLIPHVRIHSLTGTGGAAAPGTFEARQHGLTGSWYEAANSGQGFEVEIFPAPGFAQVSWFTYDTTAGGADRQRWYTLGGPVSAGDSAIPLTIYQNTGGNFAVPPATVAEAVGQARLRFDNCGSGQLDYTFTDGSGRAGSIALARLAQNVTCGIAVTGPVPADFALSGNWFDPGTSGQGISVEVNPASGVLFMAWYTYAPDGVVEGAAGQRWYTGQSTFTTGTRSIPLTLYETTGGLFDARSLPLPATREVGRGTVAFADCGHSTLAYSFTSGSSAGASGTIPLVRVGPAPPGCAP